MHVVTACAHCLRREGKRKVKELREQVHAELVRKLQDAEGAAVLHQPATEKWSSAMTIELVHSR